MFLKGPLCFGAMFFSTLQAGVPTRVDKNGREVDDRFPDKVGISHVTTPTAHGRRTWASEDGANKGPSWCAFWVTNHSQNQGVQSHICATFDVVRLVQHSHNASQNVVATVHAELPLQVGSRWSRRAPDANVVFAVRLDGIRNFLVLKEWKQHRERPESVVQKPHDTNKDNMRHLGAEPPNNPENLKQQE